MGQQSGGCHGYDRAGQAPCVSGDGLVLDGVVSFFLVCARVVEKESEERREEERVQSEERGDQERVLTKILRGKPNRCRVAPGAVCIQDLKRQAANC